MKHILVAACFAAGALVAPATVLIPSSASAVECSPNVPEAYRRPGGYCDTIGATQSLAPPVTAPAPPTKVIVEECDTQPTAQGYLVVTSGARIHVAQQNCPE